MREFIDNYILRDLQFKCKDLEDVNPILAVGYILVVPIGFWSIMALLAGLF